MVDGVRRNYVIARNLYAQRIATHPRRPRPRSLGTQTSGIVLQPTENYVLSAPVTLPPPLTCAGEWSPDCAPPHCCLGLRLIDHCPLLVSLRVGYVTQPPESDSAWKDDLPKLTAKTL